MIDQLREALEWYATEAEAIAKHMAASNTTPLMASMQVLALDGGKRARNALEAKPPADSVPMPQNEAQAELMEKLGYAWLKQHAPHRLVSADDQARRDAVWRAAGDPPEGEAERWSRDVIVVTLSGHVFKVAYYNGKDGGCWQRNQKMAELGPLGKVIAWTEVPAIDTAQAASAEVHSQ